MIITRLYCSKNLFVSFWATLTRNEPCITGVCCCSPCLMLGGVTQPNNPIGFLCYSLSLSFLSFFTYETLISFELSLPNPSPQFQLWALGYGCQLHLPCPLVRGFILFSLMLIRLKRLICPFLICLFQLPSIKCFSCFSAHPQNVGVNS
jgi:hypothetical protein